MNNPLSPQTFLLLGGIISLLIGCKDKSSVKDIRDFSLGVYTYQIKHYILDGTTLTIQPGVEDSGTFELSKTDNGIELRGGEIPILEGKNCRAAGSGGYIFDIQEQQLGYDGQLIVITGFEGYNRDGQKYHGGYDPDAHQITAYFSGQLRFTASLRVFELVGTKVK